MPSKAFRPFMLAAACLLFVSNLWSQETVRLCADSWMPFNGEPGDEKPGYVVELVRAVFEPMGVEVLYETMPWEDSLAAARSGEIDGVLCANKDEGEGLTLPAEPVGAPKMLLLTREDSLWSYDSPRALREIRLGVIADYSYWEFLDKYIAKSDSNAVYVAHGDAPLDDLLAKLDSGEVGAIVDSEAVLLWKFRQAGLSKVKYRTVYRHLPDPVYVAFSSTERGRALAIAFDEGMKKLVASGRAAEIAAGYGLRDWR